MTDIHVSHDKEENIESGPIFDLFKTPHRFQPQSKHKRTPKRKYEEHEQGNRSRTPSGQVLTGTVDLRSKFFLQSDITSSQKKRVCESSSADKSEEEQYCQFLSNLESSSKEDYRVISEGAKSDNYSKDNLSEMMREEETAESTMDNTNIKEIQRSANAVKSDVLTRYITEAIREAGQSDTVTEEDPITMDIRTIIQMVSELKIELKEEIEKDVTKMLQNQDATRGGEKLLHDTKIEVLSAKNRMMCDVLASMSDSIQTINEKLDMTDNNSAKRMVILSGFEASKKKKYAYQQLMTFLRKEVKVDAQIEDFYYIGKAEPRDIVLQLLSMQHKREIFQNKDNTKYLQNSKKKPIYFRDFLTTSQNETRKKGIYIAEKVAENDAVEQEEVSTYKGDIYIGNDKYIRQVNPPKATDVLRLSMGELNSVMSIAIDRGDTILLKKNAFTAYSLPTENYSQISRAYMKLHLNHADARHIVCAWNIPGIKTYESQDCCDDNDHGVGHSILQILTENNIERRAIFVVRKGGQKLYEERIPTYVKAAKEVIQKYPDNPLLNQKQVLQQQTDRPKSPGQPNSPTYAEIVEEGKKEKNTESQKKYNDRGRGRRRGRGGG